MNINGNINTNVKNLFRTSYIHAALISNRFFVFVVLMFPFIFIRILPLVIIITKCAYITAVLPVMRNL